MINREIYGIMWLTALAKDHRSIHNLSIHQRWLVGERTAGLRKQKHRMLNSWQKDISQQISGAAIHWIIMSLLRCRQ